MGVYNTTLIANNVLHEVLITTQHNKTSEQAATWNPNTRELKRVYTFRQLGSDAKLLLRLGYIWLADRAKAAKIDKVIPAGWGSTEIYDADEQADMVNDWMIACHPSQSKTAQFDIDELVMVCITYVDESDKDYFFD